MGPAGYQAFIDSADTAVADLMAQLGAADAAADEKAFRIGVHGLAGLLANIGMDGLSKATRALPRPPARAAAERAALASAIAEALAAARLV